MNTKHELTHYGLTREELAAARAVHPSTLDARLTPVCGNGNYHALVSRLDSRVDCPICREMAFGDVVPVNPLAVALRDFANGVMISTATYDAARQHPATTGNDRDALQRIMHDNATMADADRVRDLATQIENWKV